MRITQIDVYQISYKYLGGEYAWSGGHSVSSLSARSLKCPPMRASKDLQRFVLSAQLTWPLTHEGYRVVSRNWALS